MAASRRWNADALRAVRLAAAVLATVALAALALVWGVSEWRIRRSHDAPLVPLRPRSPPDPVAGEHMAKVVGCWAGCHGLRGEGGSERIAGIHVSTAPTLSAVLPLYSDAELARLVRYGVKRDGRSAIGMVSYAWWPLGDQDLANIFAHLRRQPPSVPIERHHDIAFRGRVALLTGEWKVSADHVDRSLPRWGELSLNTPYERGRYLASIVCSECHGVGFDGYALEGGPSLAILAVYDRKAFQRLLQTGRAFDGRLIEPMDWMPDVGFTDNEIADIYVFLRQYHGLDRGPAGPLPPGSSRRVHVGLTRRSRPESHPALPLT
jgi:cytochrome c553